MKNELVYGLHFSDQSVGEVSDHPPVTDDQVRGRFAMKEAAAKATEQFLNNFTPNTM